MPQKIAVITGANRGLGRSMAIHLAKAGVGIIGTYRTHKEEAEALEAEIAQAGGKAVLLPLDVSRTSEFDRFKETVAKRWLTPLGASTLTFSSTMRVSAYRLRTPKRLRASSTSWYRCI